MTVRSSSLDEALLGLAWSLWTELGARGMVRHHRDWAVDPEALLLFTTALADANPRLRDEALDCSLAIAPYLWVSHLKNLLAGVEGEWRQQYARFAATFNAASRLHVRLPAPRDAQPWKYLPSGKSMAGDFTAPGRLVLRLRALFGVNARADALVAILCASRSKWYSSELADEVGLPKRVLQDVLVDLAQTGVMRSTRVGNRVRYDLVRGDQAAAFVGTIPTHKPAWQPLFACLVGARRLFGMEQASREVTLLVAAQKLITTLVGHLSRRGVRIEPPEFQSWDGVKHWLETRARRLARGQADWVELTG